MRGILKLAAPLEAHNLRAIEEGFAKRLAQNVSFEIEFDKSILGGFIATIDGVVYDASFKGQLEVIGKLIRQ